MASQTPHTDNAPLAPRGRSESAPVLDGACLNADLVRQCLNQARRKARRKMDANLYVPVSVSLVSGGGSMKAALRRPTGQDIKGTSGSDPFRPVIHTFRGCVIARDAGGAMKCLTWIRYSLGPSEAWRQLFNVAMWTRRGGLKSFPLFISLLHLHGLVKRPKSSARDLVAMLAGVLITCARYADSHIVNSVTDVLSASVPSSHDSEPRSSGSKNLFENLAEWVRISNEHEHLFQNATNSGQSLDSTLSTICNRHLQPTLPEACVNDSPFTAGSSKDAEWYNVDERVMNELYQRQRDAHVAKQWGFTPGQMDRCAKKKRRGGGRGRARAGARMSGAASAAPVPRDGGSGNEGSDYGCFGPSEQHPDVSASASTSASYPDLLRKLFHMTWTRMVSAHFVAQSETHALNATGNDVANVVQDEEWKERGDQVETAMLATCMGLVDPDRQQECKYTRPSSSGQSASSTTPARAPLYERASGRSTQVLLHNPAMMSSLLQTQNDSAKKVALELKDMLDQFTSERTAHAGIVPGVFHDADDYNDMDALSARRRTVMTYLRRAQKNMRDCLNPSTHPDVALWEYLMRLAANHPLALANVATMFEARERGLLDGHVLGIAMHSAAVSCSRASYLVFSDSPESEGFCELICSEDEPLSSIKPVLRRTSVGLAAVDHGHVSCDAYKIRIPTWAYACDTRELSRPFFDNVPYTSDKGLVREVADFMFSRPPLYGCDPLLCINETGIKVCSDADRQKRMESNELTWNVNTTEDGIGNLHPTRSFGIRVALYAMTIAAHLPKNGSIIFQFGTLNGLLTSWQRASFRTATAGDEISDTLLEANFPTKSCAVFQNGIFQSGTSPKAGRTYPKAPPPPRISFTTRRMATTTPPTDLPKHHHQPTAHTAATTNRSAPTTSTVPGEGPRQPLAIERRGVIFSRSRAPPPAEKPDSPPHVPHPRRPASSDDTGLKPTYVSNSAGQEELRATERKRLRVDTSQEAKDEPDIPNPAKRTRRPKQLNMFLGLRVRSRVTQIDQYVVNFLKRALPPNLRNRDVPRHAAVHVNMHATNILRKSLKRTTLTNVVVSTESVVYAPFHLTRKLTVGGVRLFENAAFTDMTRDGVVIEAFGNRDTYIPISGPVPELQHAISINKKQDDYVIETAIVDGPQDRMETLITITLAILPSLDKPGVFDVTKALCWFTCTKNIFIHCTLQLEGGQRSALILPLVAGGLRVPQCHETPDLSLTMDALFDKAPATSESTRGNVTTLVCNVAQHLEDELTNLITLLKRTFHGCEHNRYTKNLSVLRHFIHRLANANA